MDAFGFGVFDGTRKGKNFSTQKITCETIKKPLDISKCLLCVLHERLPNVQYYKLNTGGIIPLYMLYNALLVQSS